MAVTDDERRAVHVDVRRTRVPKRQMVEKSRAGVDINARSASGVSVEFELRISNAAFRRADTAVDGDVAPETAGARAREAERRVGSAFGQKPAAVGDRDVDP